MFDFVLAGGFRAVTFSLEGVLLAHTQPTEARSLLFHRVILDPRSEPLSPLFRNKDGVKFRSESLLKPFFPDSETPPVSSLYAGYEGPRALAEEIRRMKDAGISVGVWDNCPAGTTRRLHELIDGYYPGIFPRSARFLSTTHEAEVGETDTLDVLWKGLKAGPDDILVVTANPGQRDHALRAGMASYLMSPEDRSLASALAVYLGKDGPIKDPMAYMAALGGLSPWGASLPSLSGLMLTVMKQQAKLGAIESDFRCLALDRRVWSSPGLAEEAARVPEAPAPPRFKPEEEVIRDAHRLVEGYLKQIERGIPPLSRSAMLGLMGELKGILAIKDEDLARSPAVQDLLEKVIAHVRDNRAVYVETSKVFHEDEWNVLIEVFREKDAVLDARYSAWVDETIDQTREMSAKHERLRKIRRMVKERLVDDLILRLMEIEMTHRSLKRGIAHHKLFPLHHDARNRAALFTANIDDKEAWKRSVARHTKTLAGWVRGLAAQMSRMAREVEGQLTFTHEMDAGFPQVDLSDLEVTERQAIDDILTEWVRNAVKYRRPGIPLRIVVHMSENEDRLELSVSDNGVGIQDKEAVLRSAVREHPEAEGYGGGLVSVQRHVDAHEGWTLRVDTAIDEGSRFSLSVSLKDKTARRQRLYDSGYPKI